MVCHQDRILNYKSARGLFPGHPWNRWPLLKPVTFFSRSLPSKVLMTIQRNNLRIPEGTQTYPETLHVKLTGNPGFLTLLTVKLAL